MSLARRLCFVIAFACPLFLIRGQGPAPAPSLDDRESEQRIAKLLGEMTLEEKIGQLVHFADSSTGPGAPHPDYREQVAQGNVGSLENITGAAETNGLQKLAIEKSRLHIPLLFALDVIHGYRTIFPVPLAMASTWDPSLVERASRIAAKEATREGILWFAKIENCCRSCATLKNSPTEQFGSLREIWYRMAENEHSSASS